MKERRDEIIPLKCEDCGLEWEEHFSLPIVMGVFVKKIKAVACPSCGGKKALIQKKVIV